MNLASINDWLLFVHAAMTLFMVGVIWFVQIVHYPLFRGVGEARDPCPRVDRPEDLRVRPFARARSFISASDSARHSLPTQRETISRKNRL